MNKGLIFGALGLVFGGVADYLNGEQMKEEVRNTVAEEMERRFGSSGHPVSTSLRDHDKH